MGWKFASAVASFCEAHVIVTETYRGQIEAYCADNPAETRNLRFHYIKDEPVVGRWALAAQKRFPTLHFYYNYRRLLSRVADRAAELDAQENFDIVHQVTLAGYRMPGFLWRLGKPLLWGPVGGMDNAPYRLLVSLRLMDVVGYSLRNIINSWQRCFGYAAWVYAPYASYILASTRAGEQVIREHWKRPGEYMCEIGTADADEAEMVVPAAHHLGEPLRLCWAGIMNNQRKNLPILFRALEYCESPVELVVMGMGVLKERWEALSRSLPSRHRVVFTGSVPQKQVFEEMRRSHVFCITSVKDDTSSVLLEALQQGLPVIAPDSCGFAGVITEECGMKIRIDWPRAFARAYGRALNALAQNETVRLRLAYGAIRRAEDFTWSRKTARLKEIYMAIVDGRTP